MDNQKKRRWVYAIFAVATVYFAAFYAVPGFLASSDGKAESGQCVARHEVSLDHGEHDARPWHIGASIEKIEKDGRCPYWFLKVTFFPEGVGPGSWTEGWGIPAGGHLPADATIDAYDSEDGRSIGGVVGSRVRRVILKLDGGRTIVVRTKAPREGLRRRFVWLRELRYFLCFHPAGERVLNAKLLDEKGKMIYIAHAQEGELLGHMVS
jgi:hypothetical protein